MTATQIVETKPRANGKGRKAEPKKPTQWELLQAGGPGRMYPLTPELDILNTHPYLNDDTEFMFRDVANLYRKIQTRYLCRLRRPSAIKVLGAITTRTIDFRKYAEKISYDQFQWGVRGRDGNCSLDRDGVPIFGGTGLSRSTIVEGLGFLLDSGLIERFDYLRGTTVVYAYMPFTQEFLATALSKMVCERFPCERYEAQRTEHLDTLKGIFGMIEKCWPVEERHPRTHDVNLAGFLKGKGITLQNQPGFRK